MIQTDTLEKMENLFFSREQSDNFRDLILQKCSGFERGR